MREWTVNRYSLHGMMRTEREKSSKREREIEIAGERMKRECR